MVTDVELFRAAGTRVAADGGQRAHDGVHRLAVAVQILAVRHNRRVLADLVQPA